MRLTLLFCTSLILGSACHPVRRSTDPREEQKKIDAAKSTDKGLESAGKSGDEPKKIADQVNPAVITAATQAPLADGLYLTSLTCSIPQMFSAIQVEGQQYRNVTLAVKAETCGGTALTANDILAFQSSNGLGWQKVSELVSNPDLKVAPDRSSFTVRVTNPRTNVVDLVTHKLQLEKLDVARELKIAMSNLKITKGTGTQRRVDLVGTLSGPTGVVYSMIVYCDKAQNAGTFQVLLQRNASVNSGVALSFNLNDATNSGFTLPSRCSLVGNVLAKDSDGKPYDLQLAYSGDFSVQ